MFTAMREQLQQSASAMFASVSEQFIAIVPQAILALIILVVGVLVAQFARTIVRRLAGFIGLDKLAAKVNIDRALRTIGLSGSITGVLVLLVYWLLILFFLVLASDALGLEAVSQAIGAIAGYIPHLIAALIIIVIGLLLGRFLRDVVSTSLARAGIAAGNALGYLVNAVIVIFVCLLALDQMKIDISLITTNIAVILGVVLVTAGAAIAIAVRPLLENVLICSQVRQHISIHDHIRFQDLEGEVIRFSLTSVVIRHQDMLTVVPARMLFEQRFERLKTAECKVS